MNKVWNTFEEYLKEIKEKTKDKPPPFDPPYSKFEGNDDA
jgi:hypothetical protein